MSADLAISAYLFVLIIYIISMFFKIIEEVKMKETIKYLNHVKITLAKANRALNLAEIRHINKTGNSIDDELYKQARIEVEKETWYVKKLINKLSGDVNE